MMKPTDVLRAEHQVILQVLDCLERMVEQARAGQGPPPDAARQAITFFREFADRCHHGKEEAHLFPAMEARGFPREGGPTGVMLYEHDQGRARVRGMAEAVEALEAGDANARQRFLDHAQALLDLLRQHIDKEDHCLFPMADQSFDEAEQRRLGEVFDRVEREEIGEQTHERMRRAADELAERFGVAKRSGDHAPAPGRATCGG